MIARGNPLIKIKLGGEEPVLAKWRHSEHSSAAAEYHCAAPKMQKLFGEIRVRGGGKKADGPKDGWIFGGCARLKIQAIRLTAKFAMPRERRRFVGLTRKKTRDVRIEIDNEHKP